MGSQHEAKLTPERPVDESESSSRSTVKEKRQFDTEITSIDEEEVKKLTSEALPVDSKKDSEYRVPGLLHVGDLEGAIEKCRAQVERIAKDCRAKNRRFRDTEFDLDADTNLWLHGPVEKVAVPTGVQRATDIFDTPHFFNPEGVASSNDIMQGALGDCWFLSALATVSSMPRLIEEICVARDELVGVYGFVFHKDSGWVSVIIDDMLCTNMPQYEQLSESEQGLYHEDRARYNTVARKGGKALTFAKSGSHGETWVPLIEKAYAKFYGSFSHLEGGVTGEAMEDLTGGVATVILTKDILDLDTFWTEELLKAHEDRLFGCHFKKFSNTRAGEEVPKVQGLFGDHAYSVLRAVECKGKRFVVLRNPWGQSEWTGRWADGSKEWSGEWLKILPELGHEFGDDGQFVMEYTDFLQCFNQIDRTTLFDSDWRMASSWVTVPANQVAIPYYTYGNVSFIISVPAKTKAFISLSQLNQRFFRTIPTMSLFSIGFVIVKAGDTVPLDESVYSKPFNRRVNAELELDAGTYFVYVRVDHVQMIPKPSSDEGSKLGNIALGNVDKMGKKKEEEYIDARLLGKVVSEKVLGQSLSMNYVAGGASIFLPETLDQVIQRDIAFMSKHKGRPRRAPKRQTFLRRLLGLGCPTPAPQVQGTMATDPNDVSFGLWDTTATHVTLGLKVHTRSETPVLIQARIKGEF